MATTPNTPNDTKLRWGLQRITDTYIGDQIGAQIKLILDLRSEHTHNIGLVDEAIPAEESTFRYNCHQHAFDLRNSAEVEEIAAVHPMIFPSAEYVSYLMDNLLTDVAATEADDGDHVVYLDEDAVKHTGILRSGKVESKWGLGHLWEHGTWEIPISYGNEVCFFKKASRSECVAAFVHYAERELGLAE